MSGSTGAAGAKWRYARVVWPRDGHAWWRGIDHLLLNATLAPRLKDAGVDTWVRDLPQASDRAPTWITLAATTPLEKAVTTAAKRGSAWPPSHGP